MAKRKVPVFREGDVVVERGAASPGYIDGSARTERVRRGALYGFRYDTIVRYPVRWANPAHGRDFIDARGLDLARVNEHPSAWRKSESDAVSPSGAISYEQRVGDLIFLLENAADMNPRLSPWSAKERSDKPVLLNVFGARTMAPLRLGLFRTRRDAAAYAAAWYRALLWDRLDKAERR